MPHLHFFPFPQFPTLSNWENGPQAEAVRKHGEEHDQMSLKGSACNKHKFILIFLNSPQIDSSSLVNKLDIV